jgi:hypothetical protein
MNLCKGGCGLEARHGKWCSESYYKCPGYKKQLSDRAKIRGNNGINGRCKKKFNKTDYTEKRVFEFVCNQCGRPYQKTLTVVAKSSRKTSLCRSCIAKNAHHEKNKNKPYSQQTKNERKKIIWVEQNKKCNQCLYSEYDLFSGPYELHHIDGNSKNTIRKNEEVLCANCHVMTSNYGFRGKKHKQESRQKISNAILEINAKQE